MKRILFWPSSIILLMGVLVLPACGQQDTADAISADCSGHIPREKLDSCLERARVIDETDPSAPLKALEAELEQRALHHDEAQNGPPPGADQDQGPPPPGYDPNQPPPPNYSPDDQMQRDEPPDQPPPPDSRSRDQMPPPEGPRGDVPPPADQAGPGEVMPPDEGPQGPPPDNTPPPDDSDTQGPNR
jgi:hypothetical protein